jgi:hypothetical protein
MGMDVGNGMDGEAPTSDGSGPLPDALSSDAPSNADATVDDGALPEASPVDAPGEATIEGSTHDAGDSGTREAGDGSTLDAADSGALDAADGAVPEAGDASALDASDASTFDAAGVDAAEAGLEDAADASEVDAMEAGPPAVFSLVQNGLGSASPGTTDTIGLNPTRAGDFLAVLATYFGVGPTIQGISDNAPGGSSTYSSANLRSSVGTCQAAEIWYARDIAAGATSVTVTLSASAHVDVWVLEFSGLATSGGVDMGQTGTGGPSFTIDAPTLTPSGAPALLVSAVGSCGQVGIVALGNPFIGLPQGQTGNDAAYYIATAPGTYGPVFTSTLGQWNASVAAFR